MSERVIVDTRGTFCPVPVIKTAEAVRNLVAGAELELISDDPAIEHDLPAWCRSTGHELVASEKRGQDFHFVVRRT